MNEKQKSEEFNPLKIGIILVLFKGLVMNGFFSFNVQLQGKTETTTTTIAEQLTEEELCKFCKEVCESRGIILDDTEIKEIVKFYLSEHYRE